MTHLDLHRTDTAALPSSRLAQHAAALLLLLLAVGWVLVLAWLVRDHVMDDAFIGARYVDNLIRGRGFVFNPGEPQVEGVTNIGWLLLIAPLATIAPAHLVAKTLGLGLLAVAFVQLFALAMRGRGELETYTRHPGLAAVPVVLLAFSVEFLYFALVGMETALLAVLCLTAALGASRRATSPLVAAAIVAVAVRPEAVLIFPVYAALRAFQGERSERRGLLLLAAAFVAILALASLLRWLAFGSLVPNTFYAKPSGPVTALLNLLQLITGRGANLPFHVASVLALPFLALGYARLRWSLGAGADMLAALVFVGYVNALYSPLDWTLTGRYFAPYLPAGLLLLWVGIVAAIERLAPFGQRAIVLLATLLLVAGGGFQQAVHLARAESFPGYVMAGRALIGPAQRMAAALPPGSTIATRRIGAIAYWSDHVVFDYVYGLPDPAVARLVAHNRGRFDDPNHPALAALWAERRPDYLLEDDIVLDAIARAADGDRDGFVVHGLTYRVVEAFPVGRERNWLLAERIDAAPAPER